MGTLSKLWSSFKFGLSVGNKMDETIGASDYWATKVFNWLHPDDPRAKGTATFQYGDTQVTGHGHVPAYDLGSDHGGIKEDAGLLQGMSQSTSVFQWMRNCDEAVSQIVPPMQNFTSFQSIQTQDQSMAPPVNTLQDMGIGAGLSTLAQYGIGLSNTSAPQSGSTFLSQLAQGLADSPAATSSGSSLLSNPNQCLSPLSNANPLPSYGQVNGGFSYVPGSISNTPASQPGGCFGIPSGFGPSSGNQAFGPNMGSFAGPGFNGPGFTQ